MHESLRSLQQYVFLKFKSALRGKGIDQNNPNNIILTILFGYTGDKSFDIF